MKLQLQVVLLVLVLFLVAGCQQLGLVQPETTNQRIAYGLVTVTQMRQTATLMLQQKKISKEEAMKVQVVADSIRLSLETARRLNAQQNMRDQAIARDLVADSERKLQTQMEQLQKE